jgi:hypothetical protein
MDEITNRLTTEKPDQLKDIKMKEEMMPVVKGQLLVYRNLILTNSCAFLEGEKQLFAF